MPFPYEQILASDPSNPAMVASNGLVTLYKPGDTARTPLALTTLYGTPLPNPVQVNYLGFGPAFISDLEQVAWSAGELGGLFTSFVGLKDVAVAAQLVAEDIRARALAGEFGGGGGSGGGGAPNNGVYWNRNETVPVKVISASAPWPTSAPEGSLIVRLTGTGV